MFALGVDSCAAIADVARPACLEIVKDTVTPACGGDTEKFEPVPRSERPTPNT